MRNVRTVGRVRGRWGIATVELAVVAPILILVMFGIVELGLMMRSAIQVNSVARDAARAAGAGEPPNMIQERVAQTASGLDLDELSVELSYRSYNGNGGWATTWQPMSGGTNPAQLNDQVRAVVTYHHPLLMPGVLPFLVDDPSAGTKTLSATCVMPRG